MLLPGQLVEGEEALEFIRSGISVLEKAVHAAEASTSSNGIQATEEGGAAMEEDARADTTASTSGRPHADAAGLKEQLGGALCSLAEMMMGAAGDPESVAADVEGLLQRARAANPSSPEPLQVLASLR